MGSLRAYHQFDAPELRGRATASAHELFACDIWSLGVLLVYLLTGRPDTKVVEPPTTELASACGALDLSNAGSSSAEAVYLANFLAQNIDRLSAADCQLVIDLMTKQLRLKDDVTSHSADHSAPKSDEADLL